MKPKSIVILSLILLVSACVSKKKYKIETDKVSRLRDSVELVVFKLDQCLQEKINQKNHIDSLESNITHLKATGNALLIQLSELSVITKAQAESIKASLDAISSKDAYINKLQKEKSHVDSVNLALVLNLKGALKDVNDQDIEINVEGSIVFISVSDKLLFSSGSYTVTPEAMEVLGKVADVLKAQPTIRFMVEGHTDNKPIKGSFMKDNWDLSVLRATSVVRTLQNYFNIDPTRMIATGVSEYKPVAPNDNDENRSLNRRTRIIMIPELDKFFELLKVK